MGDISHTIYNTQATIMREENPDKYLELAYASMHRHVELMVELQARGAITFDYGNNLRARAQEYQLKSQELAGKIRESELGTTNFVSNIDCFAFPGFVPAYIRPL